MGDWIMTIGKRSRRSDAARIVAGRVGFQRYQKSASGDRFCHCGGYRIPIRSRSRGRRRRRRQSFEAINCRREPCSEGIRVTCTNEYAIDGVVNLFTDSLDVARHDRTAGTEGYRYNGGQRVGQVGRHDDVVCRKGSLELIVAHITDTKLDALGDAELGDPLPVLVDWLPEITHHGQRDLDTGLDELGQRCKSHVESFVRPNKAEEEEFDRRSCGHGRRSNVEGWWHRDDGDPAGKIKQTQVLRHIGIVADEAIGPAQYQLGAGSAQTASVRGDGCCAPPPSHCQPHQR